MKLTIYEHRSDEGGIAYPPQYSFWGEAPSDQYDSCYPHELELPDGTVINEGMDDALVLGPSVSTPICSVQCVCTAHVPGSNNLSIMALIDKLSRHG
jgi:hypothetical protein